MEIETKIDDSIFFFPWKNVTTFHKKKDGTIQFCLSHKKVV